MNDAVIIVFTVFCQIWDLRNMRAPVDSVRLECGVNR